MAASNDCHSVAFPAPSSCRLPLSCSRSAATGDPSCDGEDHNTFPLGSDTVSLCAVSWTRPDDVVGAPRLADQTTVADGACRTAR